MLMAWRPIALLSTRRRKTATAEVVTIAEAVAIAADTMMSTRKMVIGGGPELNGIPRA